MGHAGDDRPVRLLHLSDMHFRASKSWDADPVLRALTDFVGKTVEAKAPPDLVAITGDLAFSGKADEYKRARAWLDQLWARLDSPPKDRLLLVPGNHDVDRGKVDFTAKSVQTTLLAGRDQQQLATVLGDKTQRAVLLKRHAAYARFAKDWFGAAQPLPWWRRVIDINGVRLHLAGLDSAWMACGDEDSTRLLLGRYQLTQTVETAATHGAAWRLALVHHPWDDLAEFDRHAARDTVHRHCDVLLRGHLHHPHPEHIRQPERDCIEFPTGCVYEASQYPNAFQWVELSAPPARRARVRFCLWHEGAWIIDKNRGDNGWWEVDLSSRQPAKPAGSARPRALVEVPAAYLAWLRRSLERVELLGAKEGRAVRLNNVYVPALTNPQVPLTKMEAMGKKMPAVGPGGPRVGIPEPLLGRVDQGSLFILAPAGAGKSTFCRWAALQSIDGTGDLAHAVPAPDEFAEPVPMALRGRLALLVPLRDFWQSMDCGRGEIGGKRVGVERALAGWIDASPPDGLTGAHLLAHLKAGSAFLLLDGLDEVAVTDKRDNRTVYPRARLLSGLTDALPVWIEAGNRILLTSRPYGLDAAKLQHLGLPVAELEPLPEELQALFVRRWFHTLGKPEKIDDLIATIRGRGDLAPLVENPMLLTAICVLYDNGGRLPEDRYDLYKSIVTGALHSRYPGDAKERDPVERRLEAIALGMHIGNVRAPRLTPAAEISWVELEQLLTSFAQQSQAYESEQVEAAVRREDLLNHSGLLCRCQTTGRSSIT